MSMMIMKIYSIVEGCDGVLGPTCGLQGLQGSCRQLPVVQLHDLATKTLLATLLAGARLGYDCAASPWKACAALPG